MAEATAIAIGTPCWWELATKDTDAALAFYGGLCGWTSFVNDGGGMPYHHLHRGEKMFGGMYDMSNIPGMEEVPAHWSTYFHCDDVDATAAKAVELGATMVKDPMDIPDTGRMAVLTDPTGAHFMLFCPAENIAGKPNADVPDVIVWNELMTKDQAKAVEFYTNLFGYEVEDMPMGTDTIYKILKAGDKQIGGVFEMSGPEFEHGPPPNWMPYIGSDNVDAVAEKTKELGGSVVHGPADLPNNIGRFVVIHDPTGAAIAFYKSAQG